MNVATKYELFPACDNFHKPSKSWGQFHIRGKFVSGCNVHYSVLFFYSVPLFRRHHGYSLNDSKNLCIKGAIHLWRGGGWWVYATFKLQHFVAVRVSKIISYFNSTCLSRLLSRVFSRVCHVGDQAFCMCLSRLWEGGPWVNFYT